MNSPAPSPHEIVSTIIEAHKAMPGAMLPILHEIQDCLGHVPEDAVPLIAKALNLSRAEVHGVITYYHHFRQQPAGRHTVRVCRAEACQAVGAEALLAHAEQHLGCHAHETTADGAITLEAVYCLGQCAIGPAIQVDADELHGRMTPQAFETLAERLRGEQ